MDCGYGHWAEKQQEAATDKTEALCRAGNISHKRTAMKTAGIEQISLFPRTHSHPLTQAELAEINGPENASHFSFYLRSLCCLSIYRLWPSSSKEQTIGPAVACQSAGDIWQSFRTNKILGTAISCSSPLETVHQDQAAGPLFCFYKWHLKAWRTRSASQIYSQSKSSLEFLQFPLLSIKTETQRKDKTENKETALIKAYSVSPLAPPHSFPSLLMFLSPI